MATSKNWFSWLRDQFSVGSASQNPGNVELSAEKDAQAIEQDLDNRPVLANTAQPRKSELKLEALSSSFLVTCSSCSSLHELDAVCYRCGFPLCKDEQNCRLSYDLDDIADTVYVCPACREL